ncbi:eukaryotic translation initiation factor 2A [Cyclospora cayetanensis]|uniref:Eukaryotic translation initiation factor 2A n=1 Tax=Cyclospora cayetanensis TaxID=88456 RepID=A0A6P6S1C2_9EIME|nr:eukaryotic translation initiation factor 2A [Cyclospora cayetanensis]
MQSELIALTRDGLELYNASLDNTGALTVDKIKTIEGVESAEWSPQGDLVALLRSSSRQKVDVLDADTWEVLHSFEGPTHVSKFSFSPLGRYLLICFRFEPDRCPENLRLVEARSAREVLRMPQRSVGELSWPPLRWTGGESFMCRMVKDSVHVFTRESLDSPNFSINHPALRIPAAGASAFFPSPERPNTTSCTAEKERGKDGGNSTQASPQGPYCAIFSKEVKGAPASLEIYALGAEASCVAKKSFYQAQEAECHWAYDGRAVLVKTHTDASDLTYYGSSALYFLKSQGPYDTRLVAPEEGPVHASIWSPSTLEFAVCYGKVPATVAVYDGSGKATSPKFRLGEGMRTSLQFCPFSKLLLWGGFGNLAGEVEVWAPRKKGILGKTVFFSLSGALLKRVEFPCLYSVQFRPLHAPAAAAAAEAQKNLLESLKIYEPNKAPLAPGAECAPKIGNFSSTGRSLSSLTQSKAGAPPGAYKPPMARTACPRLPPGAAEPPAAGPSKSSKKRQNRKNKQAGQGDGQADAEQGTHAEQKTAKDQAQTATQNDQQEGKPPVATASSEPKENEAKDSIAEELRKSIRAIKKKLTEIERLKGRNDLNDMQKVKVGSEESLRTELSKLETQLKSLKQRRGRGAIALGGYNIEPATKLIFLNYCLLRFAWLCPANSTDEKAGTIYKCLDRGFRSANS